MSILDTLAASRWSYSAGESGTVVVPPGCVATGVFCQGGTFGATMTIDDGDEVPLPLGSALAFRLFGELGPGTVIVFENTASYVITYAGAP